MAKGALAIGLGSALLLGGGGTLAVWNASATATEAGQIASGDLKMTAGAGTWSSNMTAGTITRIADYKMVPGEKLTYSQPLNIILVGDRITADLTTTNAIADAFNNEATVKIEYNTTADDDAKWVTPSTAAPLTLTPGTQTVRARIVVDFANLAAGNAQGSTMQTKALSGVGFKLTQNAPTTTAATQAPAPAAKP
ncbi:alternate-type signal peptide domain-containing protein [Arthrobacter sp. zg-Y1219]|uniref:alternate-type signal peptide domain-containing protein n=1 Tax=Arthrobacter sp. zg-Y1219 TaxID=3049067 RepID=UPI0024C37EEE|nr:alternate-type signal peptide domain-containing protein [Arthrobacter sp. zg-Y1219]MDK1360207.1 alternate-type signal peptide domain-containing protein [Arthrobacter sp. zg-Y1219]